MYWHHWFFSAPVLSHWCIWHVGFTQDSEDTIHPPCDECGSQSNHRMSSSLPPGHWQTFVALWTYCPQLTTRGPPPCCRCGDPGAAYRLEATVRKTTPGFVHWRQTLANRTLAFDSPWRRAAVRDDWRRIVDTATLQLWFARDLWRFTNVLWLIDWTRQQWSLASL